MASSVDEDWIRFYLKSKGWMYKKINTVGDSYYWWHTQKSGYYTTAEAFHVQRIAEDVLWKQMYLQIRGWKTIDGYNETFFLSPRGGIFMTLEGAYETARESENR